MQNDFLEQLEKDFYVDFSGDDRYVLNEYGNVTELYLDGVNKPHKFLSDPKHINDISIFLPLSPYLKVLHIVNWIIEDMSPIRHFTHLNELSLSHNNNISKICGLKSLTNLRSLNLSGAGITKICGLENLTKLKVLDLSSNSINKIEGLETLLQLEALYLHYGTIKKIENINHLLNLKRLQLCCSSFKKLENINLLVNLTKLTVGGELTEFPDLSNHLLLEELGVSGNFKRVENLKFHTQLNTLSVSSDSDVENLNDLLNLENLINLKINLETLRGTVSQFFWNYDLSWDYDK